MLRAAAAADAGDQRDVGDEPVHRAEHGGPQPAARDVPVLGAVVDAASICSFRLSSPHILAQAPARLPTALPSRAGNDVRVTQSRRQQPRRWHAETPGSCARAASRPARWPRDVLIEARGGRFTAVAPGTPAASVPPGTVRLPGLTLPGLANAHSHAFHRALRGAAPEPGRRRRHVLDLARAHVRGRRAARPRAPTSRSPAPSTRRWRWPGSPASASSTTCTTVRAERATATRTRWGGR